MRTYDPADGICYVHLAQHPAAPAAPQHADDECQRLPAGYPNAFLRVRLDAPRAVGARPPLAVLSGGAAAGAAPAAPTLRLVR